MTKVQFRGFILPQGIDLSIDPGATIEWVLEPNGLKFNFTTKITNSIIIIDCEYNQIITQDQLNGAYLRASDIARSTVDMISFSSGMGLQVSLSTLVDRYGNSTQLFPQENSLKDICSSYDLSEERWNDFRDVYRLVISNPEIFLILNDLVQSISIPHLAPINCFRAIEGLRHQIAPGLEPKKQWPIFNKALAVEKSYVDIINQTSLMPRHGHRGFVPGPTVRDITSRSWTLLNRFFEYKKRNDIPLSPPDFPILS